MSVTKSGSVRVDLVGGTLDIEPIHLILPNVVTINVATGLKAKVSVDIRDDQAINILSEDYNTEYNYKLSDFTQANLYQNDFFKEMTFICQLLALFQLDQGLDIKLSSNAPAGSGLGGSSSMGVVFYEAMSELVGRKTDPKSTVKMVKATEGRILNQGMPGYQDYFPALTGGVLALKAKTGDIEIEQLYTNELKEFLENHITLVYSGLSRSSGINNWSVYKSFFDKDEKVRGAMEEIARLSYETYERLKAKDYQALINLIHAEGETRKTLASTIVPNEVDEVFQSLRAKFSEIGMKMCGAGGGGCFILAHKAQDKEQIQREIEKTPMKVLEFKIDSPKIEI